MWKTAAKTELRPFNFLFFSSLGIFMFFFPIHYMGKTSIPIDHVIGMIRKIPYFGQAYILLITSWGVLNDFRKGRWRQSFISAFFALTNLVGTAGCFMVCFSVGPSWLLSKDMAPYVFSLVAVPVAILIPVGSVFLAFLVNYGLMEFTGELMVPVMRPVFHCPGRSAIDAVASFVGSYSVGLIITNNVYRKGGYTTREASIIATGFSTVSATFMIIIANTLGIIGYWNLYFWATMIVTFAVTAITLRIPPLSKIREDFHPMAKQTYSRQEEKETAAGSRLRRAWKIGVNTGASAPRLSAIVRENIIYGIAMASKVGASIMFFGVGALLLSRYTNIFDYTAYIFLPFFRLFRFPDALLAAKSASTSIADMVLPAILCKDAEIRTKFVIAVICISEVLFFSGMIPCLIGTDIPIKMRDIFIVWFERVVISILLVTPVAYLIF